MHFRSLTEPSRLSVLEQNYEYDLLEPEKLLRKYVGRDVTLVRSVQQNGTTRQEEVTARLLSFNSAPGLADRQARSSPACTPITSASRSCRTISSAVRRWSGRCRTAARQKHRVEASYLAQRLSWNADYVLTVARDDKAADLDGWVTLQERAAARRSATRRCSSSPAISIACARRSAERRFDAARARMEEAAAAPMVQEAFSEYHLYTLGRKTTINNEQTKQVSMLDSADVPVLKRFVVDGQDVLLPQRSTIPARRSRTSFRSTTSSGTTRRPGWACRCRRAPCASIRRTRRVACSSPARIASATRRRTRPLKLKIGNAFDVVCERNQIDFAKIASNVYEVEYEITLRNHKATPITVEVNEPIGGTWRMLSSSHTPTKTAAWAAAVHRAGDRER